MMFKLIEIDDVLNNLGDYVDFVMIVKKEVDLGV